MKKVLMFLVCVLMIGAAFAAGENVATSKAFVDAGVAQKQEKIPANNGAAQVLTNTGTSGSVGTKNIYDSNASYSEQTDALVTAGQFNTAVQNAINTEFTCIKYNPNDSTDCWLVQLVGAMNLPMEYTAVEYLQGNNSGTIDTGIVFNSGTLKYSVEIQTESLVGDSAHYAAESDVIGNFSSNNSRGFVGGEYCNFENQVCNNAISNFFAYVYPHNLNDSGATNQWHQLEAEFKDNTMIFTFDGRKQEVARSVYFNDIPIVLMGGSPSYTLATNRIKIRNIKIWRNGIMVRDYVTVRNSNNVFGVYDLVNHNFTATTNGDALTGGPDLSNSLYMPSGN